MRNNELVPWAFVAAALLATALIVAVGLLAVAWSTSRAREDRLERMVLELAAKPPPPPPVIPLVRPEVRPEVRVVALDPNVSGAPPETYPQVGYMEDGNGAPMPIYGRQSVARRGRWFYYTILNGVKVPIAHGSRASCLDDVACEQLVDGDLVSVPGSGGPKVAKIYDLNPRV